MYQELKYLHSIIAFFLLVVLILAIVYIAYVWFRKKTYNKACKRMALLGMTATHLQFLIGMILYFQSPLGMSNFSGAAMKDTMSRLFILEHPIMMIVGMGLITIGYMKAKRTKGDNSIFKTLVLFYSLGLIFFLSRIPWNTWIM